MTKLILLGAGKIGETITHFLQASGDYSLTVAERILRLERDGIINGYTVRVTDAFARQRITAHVLINVNPKLSDRVVRELDASPHVRAVYALSGVFDYEVAVDAGSTEEIDAILDSLGRIEGIERTQTSIVLSVKFER